jgi:hypothetical protein
VLLLHCYRPYQTTGVGFRFSQNLPTNSAEEPQMLASLERAVHLALERKRRLGQYAVVWENGHPAFLGPNPPVDPSGYRIEPARHVSGVAERDEGV